MIIAYSILLGLCIGSFLNVVVDRMLAGKSIIFPPSSCDYCHHKLKPTDLIPILSFILLAGKCRYCKKKLSIQYPLVEAITGITFAFLTLILLSGAVQIWDYVFFLIVFSGLIVTILTDLKEQIILDEVIILETLITLGYIWIFYPAQIVTALLSGVGFFGFLLLLFLITRGKGMGFGDVKFAFFMGLALGFPKIIVAFYLSFLTGAVVSLILVIGNRKSLKSAIPFGPFLAGATGITLLYGDKLWTLSLKILGLA